MVCNFRNGVFDGRYQNVLKLSYSFSASSHRFSDIIVQIVLRNINLLFQFHNFETLICVGHCPTHINVCNRICVKLLQLLCAAIGHNSVNSAQ